MDRYELIAEQIERMYNGGDVAVNDSSLDHREVVLLVSQAHNVLIRNNYFENIRSEDEHGVGAQFLVTLTQLPIVNDAIRRERYVQLPSTYINLPKNKGVYDVEGYDATLRKPFSLIPIPTASRGLYRGLWASTLQGQTGYYPEADRIWLGNETAAASTVLTKLTVKLVAGNGSNVSADQDWMLIGEVTKLLAARAPVTDTANDNNPAK